MASSNQTTIVKKFTEMLRLELTISYIDMMTSFLQIYLWKQNRIPSYYDISTMVGNNFSKDSYHVIGNSHIPLKYLFKRQDHDGEIMNISNIEKKKQILRSFQEKIFANGEDIGEMSGFLRCTNSEFIFQKTFGVETENGFSLSSYNILDKQDSSKHNDTDILIQNLKALNKNLYGECIKLFDAKKRPTILYTKIIGKLLDMKNLLHYKIDKVELASFFYENVFDLLKMQKILIKICLNLIKYCTACSFKYQSTCFELLSIIVWRKEFSLDMIGYQHFQKSNHLHSPNPPSYKEA